MPFVCGVRPRLQQAPFKDENDATSTTDDTTTSQHRKAEGRSGLMMMSVACWHDVRPGSVNSH